MKKEYASALLCILHINDLVTYSEKSFMKPDDTESEAYKNQIDWLY